MTTTGRTELERQAMRGCIGGQENVPKELKQLKIRFGEMLLDDDVGRGTADRRSGAAEKRVTDKKPRMHQASDETVCIGGQSGHSSSTGLGSEDATRESRSRLVRRAGFGTLEETRPLEKGVRYG